MGKKYMIPLLVGIIGMFICHFFVLLAFGNGVQFPVYVLTYPVLYPLFAVGLTVKHHQLWLTNALMVCVIPLLYWYLLLWSDGTFNLTAFHITGSTGMIIMLPATLGISCLATYVVKTVSQARKGSPADRTVAA